MSTYANLYIKTKSASSEGIAHLSSDGYPSFALVDLTDKAEKAFRCEEDPETHFIGELFSDWSFSGYGWSPGTADFPSYEYEIDIEQKKLTWGNDLVIYPKDKKVVWKEKVMKYNTLDELEKILEEIEENA